MITKQSPNISGLATCGMNREYVITNCTYCIRDPTLMLSNMPVCLLVLRIMEQNYFEIKSSSLTT